MPYRNPQDKREWEKTHRAARSRVAISATAWAQGQIATLRKMGIEHTLSEWNELRKDLRKSYISRATEESLSMPPRTDRCANCYAIVSDSSELCPRCGWVL